jgi:hypothetical protein
MVDSGELLVAMFEAIFPHLDERRRMGAAARRWVRRDQGGSPRGGVREATVSQGAAELDRGEGWWAGCAGRAGPQATG